MVYNTITNIFQFINNYSTIIVSYSHRTTTKKLFYFMKQFNIFNMLTYVESGIYLIPNSCSRLFSYYYHKRTIPSCKSALPIWINLIWLYCLESSNWNNIRVHNFLCFVKTLIQTSFISYTLKKPIFGNMLLTILNYNYTFPLYNLHIYELSKCIYQNEESRVL